MNMRAHLQKAKSGSSMASCRASRLSSKLYRVTSMATTRGLLPHSLAPTSDGDVHDEPSEGPREIRNKLAVAWRSLKVPKRRGQSPVRGQRGSRRDAPAGRRGRHPLPVMDTMAETTPVPPVFAVRPFPDPDLPSRLSQQGAHTYTFVNHLMSPLTPLPPPRSSSGWRQAFGGRLPRIPHRTPPDPTRHPHARPTQRRRARRTLRGGDPDARKAPRRRRRAASTARGHRAARHGARGRDPR